MGSAGGSWSWPLVLQTWSLGLMGEENGGGWFFFGEKSDLGVFERKVTMAVNGVLSIGVRERKQM